MDDDLLTTIGGGDGGDTSAKDVTSNGDVSSDGGHGDVTDPGSTDVTTAGHVDPSDPFGSFSVSDKPLDPINFDDFDPFATIQETTPTTLKTDQQTADEFGSAGGTLLEFGGDTTHVSETTGFNNTNPPTTHNPFADQKDPFGDPNPFGVQSDPFSGQSDPFGSNPDPFASHSDPFGAPKDPFQAEASDLFSAGDTNEQIDPFGDQDPFGLKNQDPSDTVQSDSAEHGQDLLAEASSNNVKDNVNVPKSAGEELFGITAGTSGTPVAAEFGGSALPPEQVAAGAPTVATEQQAEENTTAAEAERRGSEIDDDLIDNIECTSGIPITEQLELGEDHQQDEPDLLKESDSWDDLNQQTATAEPLPAKEEEEEVPVKHQSFIRVEDLEQPTSTPRSGVGAPDQETQGSDSEDSEGIIDLTAGALSRGTYQHHHQEVDIVAGGVSGTVEDTITEHTEEHYQKETDMADVSVTQKSDVTSEFDDLMGGFGGDQMVPNGHNSASADQQNGEQLYQNLGERDAEGEAVYQSINGSTADSSQLQQQDERTQAQKAAGASSPKDEKKAMEYMKERYEDTGDKSHTKIIRQPKKLDNKWEKMSSEEELTSPIDKERHPLPKEQDLVSYTAIPIDYSKDKYQEKAQQNIPVNRRPQPEKVAPPAITQNIKSLFEKGEFTDLHKSKKIRVNLNHKEGSGVSENEPIQLDGVVRESDIDLESETVDKGFTGSLIEEWKMKGTEDKKKKVVKKPIKIDKAGKGPAVLENQPKVRKDVVRETDENDKLPDAGVAEKAKKQLTEKKDEEPKEKKPIDLPPPRPGTVFENEPVVRDDVVRENREENNVAIESGKAKNLAGFWANQTDEVKLEKKAVVIEKEQPAIVLENEPVVLEGVVRSSDQDASETAINLEDGRTKNLAGLWQNRVTDDEKPLKPKDPIKLDINSAAPSVIENEPTVREDVIRSGEQTEDVIPGEAGRTKNIASIFTKDNTANTEPKEKIEIDRSTGAVVIENEPAPLREDVVRSEPTSKSVDLETGHTKNLLSHWVKQEEDASKPKTSTSKVALEDQTPPWMSEIKQGESSSGGVYENEPEQRDNVARETDIMESPDMLEEQHTQLLRNRWKQMEADAKEEKDNPPQLVRFTPPRELTPPPIYQTDYQSFQQITLCKSPTEEQSFSAQHDQLTAQDTSAVSNGYNQHTQMNGDHQPALNMSPDSAVPVTPVKSSAVLVLK